MNKDILIVDDDENMRFALSETLKKRKFKVDSSSSFLEAKEKIQFNNYPFVITDVRMPDGNGIKLVSEIKKKNFDTKVLVITAYGEIKDAVVALKNGAVDYIQKPFSSENLINIIDKYYPKNFNKKTISKFHTKDKTVLKMLERCKLAAQSNAPILIQGESGTGKELVARLIHQYSTRNQHPYIAVNCAAIPKNLLENEMFGHEKGAFTGAEKFKPGKFELADNGTLVLDEIGDMPVHLQAKLLRVIQEKEINRLGGKNPIPFDTRIISLTNQNIETHIKNEKFREDLYFRLNVIEFIIPPLRERPEDIKFLAEHFLNAYTKSNGNSKKILHSSSFKKLQNYKWPGNVRELQNIMLKTAIFSTEETIYEKDIEIRNLSLKSSGKTKEIQTVAEMEQELIYKALDKTNQNKTKAAELLGISSRTLRNKLTEYESDCN